MKDDDFIDYMICKDVTNDTDNSDVFSNTNTCKANKKKWKAEQEETDSEKTGIFRQYLSIAILAPVVFALVISKSGLSFFIRLLVLAVMVGYLFYLLWCQFEYKSKYQTNKGKDTILMVLTILIAVASWGYFLRCIENDRQAEKEETALSSSYYWDDHT